ncbi:MAG: DUF2480 family protein [Cytophagales bacterium]|nr:DUF2480 family protein [Cytophagales bacterium]
MENQDVIVNRVAKSSLITLNLEDYYSQGERVVYDIKDNLYEGIALKEKEFRKFVKENDWTIYKNKNVALTCSVDAVIPTWAYMLLTVHISPYANRVVWGDLEILEQALFQDALSKIDLNKFKGAKVIVKGCGSAPIPPSAYVEITRLLMPVALSIMFGEACSAVPLFKKTQPK